MKTNNRQNNNRKNNKQKMAKQYVKPTTIRPGAEIEYHIPASVFNELAKECKGTDVQSYLCNYVNEQLGLLGTCVRVVKIGA